MSYFDSAIKLGENSIPTPSLIPWYTDPNWWLVIIAILGFLFGSIKYRENINAFFTRLRLQYFPVRFNVALSFNATTPGKSNSYNTEVKKQLSELIDSYNLSKQIRIIDLQNIFKFKDKDEAQKFCKKKGLDLIIWGDYSENDLKDKEGSDCNEVTIKFTYRHPDVIKGNLGKMIELELRTVLPLKSYFKIINGSIDDIKVIGENIFDISTYILGLTLKLFGKIEQSITILETVVPKTVNKNDIFSKGIQFHLINDYILLTDEAYWQNNYERGAYFSKKILEIDPNSFYGLANTAVFAYKLGDSVVAKRRVLQLENLHPDNPLTWVDVAFFRILEKDYKGAYRMYKKLTDRVQTPNNFNPVDVIEFLELQTDKNFEEPAFIYGSAIFNYYYADKARAIMLFRKFLKLANNQDYRKMRQNAKKLLL